MYDRRRTVGGSDAVHIQAGHWAELFDRKTSTDSNEYPLAAELGHTLEPFNRTLFEREIGLELIFDEQWQEQPFVLPGSDWCTYTPDGLVDQKLGQGKHESYIPFEAKAVNMMWKPENLLAKYMPQLQHAMRVMNAPYAYFSVIYLNTRYECIEVPYDEPYDMALFEREKLFMWHLESGVRPPEKKGRKWV